jgi:hypothetical protein
MLSKSPEAKSHGTGKFPLHCGGEAENLFFRHTHVERVRVLLNMSQRHFLLISPPPTKGVIAQGGLECAVASECVVSMFVDLFLVWLTMGSCSSHCSSNVSDSLLLSRFDSLLGNRLHSAVHQESTARTRASASKDGVKWDAEVAALA